MGAARARPAWSVQLRSRTVAHAHTASGDAPRTPRPPSPQVTRAPAPSAPSSPPAHAAQTAPEPQAIPTQPNPMQCSSHQPGNSAHTLKGVAVRAWVSGGSALLQIGHSTIDDEFTPDRKGGFVGGEEDNGLGNLAGIS